MIVCRRGVILPIVLFVLMLLGLFGAMFSFRINADLAATEAVAYRLQTRLAAEAGVERVKLLLRTGRMDPDVWYNNPDELNRIVVWAAEGDETIWGTNERYDEKSVVYRFSIVADDPTDDEEYIRFGITDEASKINLNTATEAQLLTLLSAVIDDDGLTDPQPIVDAILDWRDEDHDPHGEFADTEGDYYRDLDRPYRMKNGPFSTVEELLLVKGMTGQILYGEDFDRNGLITPNEDDGDDSFPPDNGDGELRLGLYNYLTVLSAEDNVANDARPRVYLAAGNVDTIREELEPVFAESPEVVDFVVAAVQAAGGQSGGGGSPGGSSAGGGGSDDAADDGKAPGSGGGRGFRSGSRMETLTPSTQGGNTKVGGGKRKAATSSKLASDDGGGAEEVAGQKAAVRSRVIDDSLDEDRSPDDSDEEAGGDHKSAARSQVRLTEDDAKSVDDAADMTGDDDVAQAGGGDEEGDLDGNGAGGDEEEEAEEEGDDDQSGGAGVQLTSPASLINLQLSSGPANPITVEHLAILMDRTSVYAPQTKKAGLININTASSLVLHCIDGITDEQVASILSARDELSAEEKATTAWLVTQDVMTLDQYEQVAPMLTARGQQFTIQALGFADHVGMVTRLQVVVDMLGPVAQTVYYRDLTSLGGHFPIREEDEENIRGE